MKKRVPFWLLIVCIVAVSAGISLLITSPSHKKDSNQNENKVTTGKVSENVEQVEVPNDNTSTKYFKDVWLTDLEYIKKGDVNVQTDNAGQANTGVEYAHYLSSASPYSEVVYNLNGNYDVLTALWTISYYDRDTDSMNSFDIYVDDQLVYTSPTITGGDLPVDVSVDVSGCKILTIMFKDGTGSADLANIRLSSKTEHAENKENNEEIKLPCWLTDLEYLVNDNVSLRANDVGMTNTGEEYSHYMFGSSGDSIEYYLNGEYDRLTGVWSICYENRDTATKNKFTIYSDSKLIYESPRLDGGDDPVNIDVNIENCKILKIVFNLGNGQGEFANIRLFPTSNLGGGKSAIEENSEDGTWLTSLHYLKNSEVITNDYETRITNTGEKYSHYICGDEQSNIIYYVEGKYSSLAGVWAISQERRDEIELNSFDVYADDVLVYTSPSIKGGDLPVLFEIGINNCQKLKIVFTQGTGAAEIGNIMLGHKQIEKETSVAEKQSKTDITTAVTETATTLVETSTESEVKETESITKATEIKTVNSNSPFEGEYWVIFTEGNRGDRVEATSVKINALNTEGLAVIWNGSLDLNQTNSSVSYIQYYLIGESKKWCRMGTYHRFSDKASNVIASNLDVYDQNGNLLIKRCSYEDIDWSLVDQYR